MNICEKYWWISHHPKIVDFADSAIIEVTPHMVCPETNQIENLSILNTKLQFWVEFMTPHFDEQFKIHGHAHDWELDCGGDTWEEAIEALYQGVLAKYGNYTQEDLDKQREEAMKDFDADKFFANATVLKTEPEERKPLEDYEIDAFKRDIEHIKKLLPVLSNKLKDANLTMQEYADVELEIICADRDLYVATKSLECGYDVEVYGITDENN
ncbi:hypothetical protein pEaSNUABM50_00128 [Erwinia phage pEa_SNUABM_50]|uniref:Uncharacterized protein n=1 Tax=Erwinia phage pEa_SNUABM_50 TaxID=2768775 RepID=A0A7L8ZPN1_9CAUD|nr:hypothetical protein pEaSNUABM50_00128 [Erwinia phage pEa_SNUABM_50]QXO11277.1 hypothetical protein pEaSNUABM19_00131 [Erwinia phage pEa_SNUABM_19]QXO11825.1 hypothetical protein pEaSNUABM44_00129 [Erwinia phage pEa_SNUABM_44]